MSALSIQVPYQIFADSDGTPLDNGYVWIGTQYLDPRTNPVNVYFDAALTQVAPNPLRTVNGYVYNAGSPAQLYIDGVNFSLRVEDKKSVLVCSFPDGSGISPNASGVGYTPAGTGAVATDVESKLRESANAVNDFGADNTGATNTTTQLLNFFNACISTGKPGHIPAGSYLVTSGVLVFDNGWVDKAWPAITTDGYDAVTFKRADATDAPIITISNGTASSGVGNYWNGGELGGITFDQNAKTKGSNQHGLSLRGIWGTKFGWMRTNDAGGSCIVLPQFLFGGSNPDPYAVTFCEFDGIEANRCSRYALENNNYVGLNGCTIKSLRAINTLLGGWYGFGAGNKCDIASAGSCGGWAFDDGVSSASTGGSPSRIEIGIAELDDVENGFRINKLLQFKAKQVRIIPRYNFSALNPSGGYWPRIGISIGGGTSPSCGDIELDVIWRIEAGGLKTDLGSFTNMHSIASTDIHINNRVLDNAGFGIADSDLFTNVSNSSSASIFNSGKLIYDSRIKPNVLVRSATSVTVPNSGYGTATSKIAFATVLSDRNSYYDIGNSWFTVPYTGQYRVSGRIALAIAAGTLVRLGFATDTGGSVGTVLNKYSYSVTANAESYEINGVISLTVGQRLFLIAQQGTGAAVNLSTPISATTDLTWSVAAL